MSKYNSGPVSTNITLYMGTLNISSLIIYYRLLAGQKRSDFWCDTIDSQGIEPRRSWQSIEKPIGRGHPLTTTDPTADDLHRFFVDKVVAVRDSAAGAPDPSIA
jgi:hypothetical protein